MTTSIDGKLNKSIVVSKLYDQKIKSLENEVQKKVIFYKMLLFVCVRACVRACVRVCVC